MTERLEAHFENRIYYFSTTSRTATEIRIVMYSTNYIFEFTDEGWRNATVNRMMMDNGLIQAVVEAIDKAESQDTTTSAEV